MSQMKITPFLVLSLCLLLSLYFEPTFSSGKYSEPRFNFNKFNQQNNREWTRVSLGVEGGSGNYEYFYDQYPVGWKYIQDSVYIPKQSLTVNRKYPIKVRIEDELGNQARATIVYIVKNGKVSVLETLYPYNSNFDNNFYNSNGFNGVPTFVKSGSYYDNTENLKMEKYKNYMPSEELKRYENAINQISSVSKTSGSGLNKFLQVYRTYDKDSIFSLTNLLNPQKKTANSNNPSASDNQGQYTLNKEVKKTNSNNATLNQPTKNNNFSQFMNGFFQIQFEKKTSEPKKDTDYTYTRLPSASQLDQFILKANSTAFEKLVDQINKISTMTCQQKDSYLDDFLGRIQSAISMKKFALSQLQILQQGAKGSYTRLNAEISQLKSQTLTLDVKTMKDKLKQSLTQLQNLYNQFNAFDLNSDPFQNKVAIHKKNIEVQRTKSQMDRQQLMRQKLSYNEADLVVQVFQKQLNDAKYRKAIIEKTISDSQKNVNQAELNIKKQEQAINTLNGEVKSSQDRIDYLKINYTNLESTVSRYRSDIAKNSKKQTALMSEGAALEQRLRIERAKIASDQYERLKEMISTLQKNIPTIQEFIDKSIFDCFKAPNLEVVKNGSSVVYVVSASDFKSYIESVYQLGSGMNLKLPSQIKFSQINIMDSQWESSYGLPYDLLSFANAKDFSFTSDFNCLNPSSLTSGYGTITSIGSKFIEFMNESGDINRLKLGTCTRLETTSLIPGVGQTIYWRGIGSENKKQFNAYRATCI